MQLQQTGKKSERYERILAECTRLFVEKGYEQTTISDVVKACDMARGTFYLYFDSLEQVLKALFTRTMNLLWEQVEANQAAFQNSVEAALAEIIRSVFRMLTERKELLSVFRCGGGQKFNEYKYHMIRDHIGKRVSDMLERGVQSCDARPCSSELVSLMITTLVDHMAYYTVALQEDGYPQETVEQELLDFIRYGVTQRNLV
ncbi:MAG: TetR/AcrR family transcriptional regulator [Tumebacillaceae bacterium]